MYEDLAQDFNNSLFKIYEYILYNIYLYIKYVYYLYIHYILIGFKTQSPISVMCIWIWDHPRTAYQQPHTQLKKNDSHFFGAMNFQQLPSLGWSLVSRPPPPHTCCCVDSLNRVLVVIAAPCVHQLYHVTEECISHPPSSSSVTS